MRFASFVSAVFLVCSSTPAFAYYALLDNGEVMKPGHYKLTGDLQALTDDGGLNAGGRIDAGLDEEFGVRGVVGFGEIDYFFGALFKWMPVPDIESQPAMGANMGILYGKDGDVSDLTFRIEPMLSKRITIDQTFITPYVALPVGLRIRKVDNPRVNDDTKGTFQLVFGGQLQVEQWKNLQFLAEIGLDLDQAPGYISAGAIFYFDSENGFSLE